MRLALAATTLLGGIVLAVLGFFMAAPIGPTTGPVISDPRVIFAPGIFVTGVILAFGSAIVYEIFPEVD